MSDASFAQLSDRGVVAVTGEDAGKLLQGVLTNDMDRLELQPAIHAGLLTPQGKILFEFFVAKVADGFLLEVASDKAADLAKRLTMYRLKAKAEIRDVSDTMLVQVAWGKDAARAPAGAAAAFSDPRHPGLGQRIIERRPVGLVGGPPPIAGANVRAEADYHAHRIALGSPEGGKDYDFGDAFPHEANFDLLHGVSFEKGCYVGQEVVARMQHKTVVRKRVVRVTGARELPATRPDVKAGEVVIGRLGSVAGVQGLAMLRLDRVLEFQDKGVPLTADGIGLEVDAEVLGRYRAGVAQRPTAP